MNNLFLETIKAEDGNLFHLEYHQQRYEKVLSSLGVTRFQSLKDLLKPPQDGLYRCRILYSTNSLEVSYHLYAKRRVSRLKLIFDDTIEYSKKYADRDVIDKIFAQRAEADDILIIKNGLVTDTSIANIAFFDGDRWLTPKNPLLEGTTRARLLNEGTITASDIDVSELQNFTKVALLNAMIDFDIITEDKIKALYC